MHAVCGVCTHGPITTARAAPNACALPDVRPTSRHEYLTLNNERNNMPKPVAKTNLVHQQILGALIETKPVSWTRKTLDSENNLIETKVEGTSLPHTTRKEQRVKNVRRGVDGVYRHDIVVVDVPVPTIAGNVSADNVERAAKRWIR